MRYNTLKELQDVINTLYEIDDILQGESSEAVKKAIAAVQDAWNVVKRERRDENRDKLIRQNAILQARRETFVDEDKVRDLVLFIENDGNLYRQRTLPIIDNLKKKIAKGIYDETKALILWGYLADDGAKRYDKELGSGRGSMTMFNKAEREEAAKELARYYDEHIHE